MNNECTCLTAEDASLPHYSTCPAAGSKADNSNLRCLAEIAAISDIDTALYVLRIERNKK